MTGWLPWVATAVPVGGLGLAWVNVRMAAAKFHRENEPVLQVEAYWMNRRIPHVTIEHQGPTLDRVELEVLDARAGTRRAGLLMETGQGRAVDTYELAGPIVQGDQKVIRVALDGPGRGREMKLRVRSHRAGSSVWWRRWLRIGQRSWTHTFTISFPPKPTVRISTADLSSRIPTQAEILGQREQ